MFHPLHTISHSTGSHSTGRLRAATLAVATVVALATGPALADGDAAKGEKLFARCKACHTINAGGPNRVGPNLHGVVGREAGTADGFRYSNAIKDSGITWTPENLDAYLTSPAKFLKGNRMSFAGLAKAEDRADIIAYLSAQK